MPNLEVGSTDFPTFASEDEVVAWMENLIGKKIDTVRRPNVVHRNMERIVCANQIMCVFPATDEHGSMVLTFTPFR